MDNNLLTISDFKRKEAFFEACRTSLEDTKYILENFDIKADVDDSISLRCAIQANRLDILKYLLTCEKKANILDANNSALNMACLCGHFDIVKYLLSSDELEQKAWIHGYVSDLLKDHPISVKNLDMAFTDACSGGNVEIVKYLLESPELPEHCSIYAQQNLGFRNACKKGHLGVVEYLLQYPGFSESENYQKSLYEGVIVSFHHEHRDITQYLLGITKITNEGQYNLAGISDVLSEYPTQAKELISLITYQKLHQELNEKSTSQRSKI